MRMKMLVLAAGLMVSAAASRAADASLGFVEARGSFQMDGARVWNHATVFEGTVLETGQVPSRVRLADGSEVRIAAESRVRLHAGKADLEKGAGQVDSSRGYELRAGTFLIATGKGKVTAHVERKGERVVVASAMTGTIRVRTAQGILVADVAAGNTVTLDPEPPGGREGVTRVAGCVSGTASELRLLDQATNLVFAIQGGGVEKEIGNSVEITGTTPAGAPAIPGVAQTLAVTGVKRLEAGVCGSADRMAAGHAGHGARTIAIVGGVGVAATGGGLAAAGTLSGRAQTAPATSR